VSWARAKGRGWSNDVLGASYIGGMLYYGNYAYKSYPRRLDLRSVMATLANLAPV
jgi:hypothetical protein